MPWGTASLTVALSDGLRRVLCQVGLRPGPEGENSSLVDRLMLNDSKMWKGQSSQAGEGTGPGRF